jgi:phosphate transport system permease protein
VSGYDSLGAGAGPGGAEGRRLSSHPLSRRRRWTNRVALVVMGITVVLVLIPVVMILFQITSKGLATMNWEFLTKTMPFSMRKVGGGFLNALVGTLLMVGVATLISVPLGILAAV